MAAFSLSSSLLCLSLPLTFTPSLTTSTAMGLINLLAVLFTPFPFRVCLVDVFVFFVMFSRVCVVLCSSSFSFSLLSLASDAFGLLSAERVTLGVCALFSRCHLHAELPHLS